MPFAQLTPDDDATLHWRQPSRLDSTLVLVAEGDRTVARITADAADMRRARAETPSGTWIFEQSGFWTPSIVVRDGTTDVEIARLDVRSTWTMRHADLTGPDGTIARWELQSLLEGIVAWHTVDERALIVFRRGTDEGGDGLVVPHAVPRRPVARRLRASAARPAALPRLVPRRERDRSHDVAAGVTRGRGRVVMRPRRDATAFGASRPRGGVTPRRRPHHASRSRSQTTTIGAVQPRRFTVSTGKSPA